MEIRPCDGQQCIVGFDLISTAVSNRDQSRLLSFVLEPSSEDIKPACLLLYDQHLEREISEGTLRTCTDKMTRRPLHRVGTLHIDPSSPCSVSAAFLSIVICECRARGH